MSTSSFALATRWTARVWSILSLLVVLAFAVGEFARGGPGPTPQEWLGLVFWPIGVCVGLVLAWFREEIGGSLALACLFAFCIWNLLRSGHLPQSLFFFLLAAPGLLFLCAAFLSHRIGVSRI